MGEHTVTSFDDDLNEIDRLIRDMADLAGSMVGASISALLSSDAALAQRVISDDTLMDARQRELDDKAITLIAKAPADGARPAHRARRDPHGR